MEGNDKNPILSTIFEKLSIVDSGTKEVLVTITRNELVITNPNIEVILNPTNKPVNSGKRWNNADCPMTEEEWRKSQTDRSTDSN